MEPFLYWRGLFAPLDSSYLLRNDQYTISPPPLQLLELLSFTASYWLPHRPFPLPICCWTVVSIAPGQIYIYPFPHAIHFTLKMAARPFETLVSYRNITRRHKSGPRIECCSYSVPAVGWQEGSCVGAELVILASSP